jgi:gas vesicle protein
MDYNFIFLIIGVVVAVGTFIATNYWNKRNRTDKLMEDKNNMSAQIENSMRQKFIDDKKLAEELLRNNKDMVESLKEELRDYVDKGDLDVKRELAYAIKLIDKDITFLQQFIFGKESKSLPGYLSGEEDTREHAESEGHGMFRDTEQEAIDRKGAVLK